MTIERRQRRKIDRRRLLLASMATGINNLMVAQEAAEAKFQADILSKENRRRKAIAEAKALRKFRDWIAYVD